MGKLLGYWGAALLFAAGCQVKTSEVGDADPKSPPKIDPDKLKDQVDDVVDMARDVEICPGYTVEELLAADSLSQQCRDALLSFLPKPQNSFTGRLIAPGGARLVDGELRVLVQGADADGAAMTAADLRAGLQLQLELSSGASVVPSDRLSIFFGAADLDPDLLSIAVVNDYSASMLDGDLDDVEDVERSFMRCLPPVHETEVLRFSETVSKVLAFSSEPAAIDAALERDDDFERGTTALFDGLGSGLEDLSGRDRPVHLVILATDGRENASTTFDKAQVLVELAESNTFIVVLGGLLADVGTMKELTAGSGVYFYTREFSALATAVEPFCDSLSQLTELRIPIDEADVPTKVMLSHADLDAQLELDVTVE
jgi:hypothetical protein